MKYKSILTALLGIFIIEIAIIAGAVLIFDNSRTRGDFDQTLIGIAILLFGFYLGIKKIKKAMKMQEIEENETLP